MRKIKIASAINPDNDFVELNDFYGLLCTQFQTLGISRRIEYLTIKNRNILVDNNPEFKKYSLTIEILSKYSEYEMKYYEFLTFLDRNKKNGFRLYYKPYDNKLERYCLCSLENSSKVEKRQPITLVLSQNSLWFGERKVEHTSRQQEIDGNLFVFDNDNGYYSASFSLDNNTPNYYCIAFYNGTTQQVDIKIESYDEVPLIITINAPCLNPYVRLFRKSDDELIREIKITTPNNQVINNGYIEINANILENGVWYVDKDGNKQDLTELLHYEYGSPYLYLDNGEYYIEVIDEGDNQFTTDVSWTEEYEE